MELKGEYRIPAPREQVWAMLNDPDVLRDCIPGCESLEGSPGEGVCRARHDQGRPGEGDLQRRRSRSRTSTRRRATRSPARARAASPASPRAAPTCIWRRTAAATLLTYVVNAQVGGKLAQLGSRLIDSTAKKLADQFFSSLRREGRRGGVRRSRLCRSAPCGSGVRARAVTTPIAAATATRDRR